MRSPSASLAILVAVGCGCSGLLVGPVRLAHNRRYITYALGPSPQNSTLECPIVLEDDDSEVVHKVSWKLWEDEQEVGSFEWQPDVGAVATGRLEVAVNLERTDGYLELTTLRYDLSGYYSCAVTLTNGKKKEVGKFETLIIDTTSNHILSDYHESYETCVLESSFSIYAVFPEPTIHAGMYSAALGGYYNEVTKDNWLRQVYENGSVAFSFDKQQFEIDEDTPSDAKFLVVVAVIKTDGNYIPLISTTRNSSLWTERGCPPVKLWENQNVEYKDVKSTCRGEYKPDMKTAKALVKCKDHYHSDGSVDSVELVCHSDTLTWTPKQFQQLKCVMSDHDHIDGDGDGGASCLPTLAILLSTLLLALLLH